MASPVTIEKLSAADRKALAHIYVIISDNVGSFFNWNFQKAMDEFEKSESLVLKLNSEIMSFVTYRVYEDRFEIMAMGSNPSHLRMGNGSQLMNKIKNIAAQQSLAIWLEVHENNHQAVQFYLKNQFTVVTCRKSYYLDGGSALVMRA